MLPTEPTYWLATKSPSESTVTTMVATNGVLRVGWVVPSTLGSVSSRPIVKRVLVT